MGNLSRLIVSLGLDSADYQKGLGKADQETGSKLSSIGSKLESLGSKMTGVGKGLTAGVTAPIVGLGLLSMDAASDLEESMSKVNVVFGESAEKVIWFSESAAESLGQSQQQALEAAGTFGNLFVSMEMAPDAAAGMSTTMVRLASDLASFNNSMPEEALDALRAGLTGETEPLKRFGININAATVATKALELGLTDAVVDMDKVNAATLDLEEAQAKLATMTQGVSKDSLEYKKAQNAVAEAQQRVNKLASAGGVDQLALEKAILRVQDAEQQLAGALMVNGEGSIEAKKRALQLKEAQQKLAEVQRGGTVDTVALRKAQLGLKEAQQKLGEMTQGVSEDSMEYRQQQQAVIELQNKLDAALAGTTQELTASQKAQATYALIMDQTTLAQEDFMRTSDGLANSSRIMKAQLADAAATMGQHLLPIGLKVVGFVNELIGKFTTLEPKTQKIILVVAGVAAAIGPLLVVGGTLISTIGTIAGGLGAVAGIMSGPVLAVIAAVVGAVLLLKAAWDNNFMGIRDTLTEVWENTLKPALEKLWEWLQVNIPLAIETLRGFWENTLLPAIQTVWTWIQENLMPLFEALWQLLQVTLGTALEILAGLWENVLKPAIEMVWKFIQDKVMPIFRDVISILEDRLGPAFTWLKDEVLAPVKKAFKSVGNVIESIIGFINDLIGKIQGIELPSWLQPGSPTPFELGLWGINRALKAVARRGLPELEVAVQGVSRGGDPLGAGRAQYAAPLQGDRIEIHNHGAAAAALTMAEIEARRRARLNLSMG